MKLSPTRGILSLLALSLFLAAAPAPNAGPKLIEAKPITAGHKVIPLFPAGHAALRAGKNFDRPEIFLPATGQPKSVSNIHNPSLELYLPPAGKANGMAIILAPGATAGALNVATEGTEVATWLNSLGITCFIERYRLAPEGYTAATDALADTQRAVRLVRANAKEWGIDPAKIGHLGFGTGGEQSARLALNFDAGTPDAADAIDRLSSRPDFVAAVYADWTPGSLNMARIPATVPATFLVCAGTDDWPHAKLTIELYTALSNFGQNLKPSPLNVEMHVYGQGGPNHGIQPLNGVPLGAWQTRLIEWVADQKLMPAPKRDPKSGNFLGT